jgi:hypothetical protein
MKKLTRPIGAPPLRPTFWNIDQLPGLDIQDRLKLRENGIQTTRDLWQKTGTPGKQQLLAAQLQIHLQHVQKWAALVNLARIPIVGCQYCGLLLHAGISSPVQLAEMPLQRLHKLILRFYVATLRQPQLCPSREQLVLWIQQARQIVQRDNLQAFRSVIPD